MGDARRIVERLIFPIRVLAQHVEAQADGRTEVRNLLTLPAEGGECLAVFTSKEKADEFAGRVGAEDARIGVFEQAEDFVTFLERVSPPVTHVTIDLVVDPVELEIEGEVETVEAVIGALRSDEPGRGG